MCFEEIRTYRCGHSITESSYCRYFLEAFSGMHGARCDTDIYTTNLRTLCPNCVESPLFQPRGRGGSRTRNPNLNARRSPSPFIMQSIETDDDFNNSAANMNVYGRSNSRARSRANGPSRSNSRRPSATSLNSLMNDMRMSDSPQRPRTPSYRFNSDNDSDSNDGCNCGDPRCQANNRARRSQGPDRLSSTLARRRAVQRSRSPVLSRDYGYSYGDGSGDSQRSSRDIYRIRSPYQSRDRDRARRYIPAGFVESESDSSGSDW